MNCIPIADLQSLDTQGIVNTDITFIAGNEQRFFGHVAKNSARGVCDQFLLQVHVSDTFKEFFMTEYSMQHHRLTSRNKVTRSTTSDVSPASVIDLGQP